MLRVIGKVYTYYACNEQRHLCINRRIKYDCKQVYLSYKTYTTIKYKHNTKNNFSKTCLVCEVLPGGIIHCTVLFPGVRYTIHVV